MLDDIIKLLKWFVGSGSRLVGRYCILSLSSNGAIVTNLIVLPFLFSQRNHRYCLNLLGGAEGEDIF